MDHYNMHYIGNKPDLMRIFTVRTEYRHRGKYLYGWKMHLLCQSVHS